MAWRTVARRNLGTRTLIRSGIRLVILYAFVWILSTQWGGANRVAMTIATGLADSLTELRVAGCFFAFLVMTVAWRILTLPFWISAVPLDEKLGPLRHPYPNAPLRAHLRLRPSRVLAVFALEIFGLLVILRTLPAWGTPAAGTVPEWMTPADDISWWLQYAIGHAAVIAIIWVLFSIGAHIAAAGSGNRYGFARYQIEQQPLARLLTTLIVATHLPIMAFAATSHAHPLHMAAAAGSLLGLLLIVMFAQFITLLIERQHDRWLAGLERQVDSPHRVATAAEIRLRTLRFLHPHRTTFPLAARADRDEQDKASSHDRADGASGADDPANTEPAETHVAARTLALALTHRERGEYRRARALLNDTMVLGNTTERQRAEALLKTLPAHRIKLVLSIATACIAIAFVFVIVSVWLDLPSGPETQASARSAHIHVRKSSNAGNVNVALLGTRYDYSLNTRIENISPHFINAVIASEDHRFYTHGITYKVAKFAQAGVICLFRKMVRQKNLWASCGSGSLPSV